MMRINNVVHIIPEALLALTVNQAIEIAAMANGERTQCVEVYGRPFDLPAGYVSFVRRFDDGSAPIVGGIDTDGRVST